MTFAYFPLGSKPLGEALGPNPTPSAFEVFINSFDGQGQYLIEITGYVGGLASGGVATLAEIPLASFPLQGSGDVGETILRYADRHWVGAPSLPDTLQLQDGTDLELQDNTPLELNTSSAVTNANTYYEGRVVAPLLMERSMPLVPEDERRVQRQFGAIEILNGDAELDSFVQSLAIDGRQVRVLFGPYMDAYESFGVVANALGTGWEASDLNVRVNLRDQSYSLDLPVQSTLYAGTGGAEGTADSEGKPKPLTYGRVRNITPAVIDPANLIYQVHDGPIFAVDDVFDQGAALTDSLDDAANYAALVSLPVSAGEFATSLAAGMLKLGSSPAGLITCDVQGDANPTYSSALDVIALRILQDRAGLPLSLIEKSSFVGAAAVAGAVGLYISQNETPTAAQVMNDLTRTIAGWWGAGRDGRIRMGRLTDPSARSPGLFLDDISILRLEPEPQPVPRFRQKVGYQRNWTEQGEDLAAVVSDARRQFLAEEYRIVSSVDAAVQVRHSNATDPAFLPTLMDSATDAQTLADTLKTLFSADRNIYRATVKRVGYLADLGSYVNVTWPRLGLSAGKNMAVIGISDRADTDTIILRLWG